MSSPVEGSPHRPDLSILLEDFHLAPADIVIVDETELVDLALSSEPSISAASGECTIVEALGIYLSGQGAKRPFSSPWHNVDPDSSKAPELGKLIRPAGK